MKKIELAAVQERFADIVWSNEPIASGELVKICEKELNWKKPTTYTVLRKLCEKGLLQNKDGVVSSLILRIKSLISLSKNFFFPMRDHSRRLLLLLRQGKSSPKKRLMRYKE